ncbi:NEAT domain-containing protein [Romboutsia sp. 1001713B170207_170306_H8]|uniref:NEAT domain-containing protein n=1 Tax=Romboutsia sp. 1001713B170207_170306_H8 TaxID=2787112 RepID=UPI00082145FE|nr:NEAT domain-containing protein [Romboutsia sp. 1001713B170207_170306_H8]SCH40100.1 Iron Transport-associated domain [uncultured Clostridium sp.]
MKSFKNILQGKISKLMSLLLIGIMTLTSNFAYADKNDEIASGIYTLTNETKYLDGNEIGDSMSRSYTDDNMTLEKRDGKIYYTLGLSGAQYMNNHRILVNDESVEFEKVEENLEEGTIKLKFEVTNPDDTILIQMYVDAMGRDVEYQLIPNLDSLELVEAFEESTPEEVDSSSEDKESENVQTQVKESSQNNLSNVIIIGVVVILAITIIFVLFKRKK